MDKIIKLGNIYRENSGGSFAGNVYNPNGICLTINICGGRNRGPLITMVTDNERK